MFLDFLKKMDRNDIKRYEDEVMRRAQKIQGKRGPPPKRQKLSCKDLYENSLKYAVSVLAFHIARTLIISNIRHSSHNLVYQNCPYTCGRLTHYFYIKIFLLTDIKLYRQAVVLLLWEPEHFFWGTDEL